MVARRYLLPLLLACSAAAPACQAEDLPAFVRAYGQPVIVAYAPALAADESKIYAGARQIDLFARDSGDWLEFIPFSSAAHGVGVPDLPGRPLDASEVSGLAIGNRGDIFALDRDHSAVHRYNREGAFMLGWGGQGDAPALCPEWHQFTSIAAAPDWSVYVLDTEGWYGSVVDDPEPFSIRRFDENGVLPNDWATHTGAGGERWSPVEIAARPDGGVWLLDRKWQESGIGENQWHVAEVWLFRYTPDGAGMQGVLLPLQDDDLAFDISPSLACGPDGRAWVVIRGWDAWRLLSYAADGQLVSERAYPYLDPRSPVRPDDFVITPDGEFVLRMGPRVEVRDADFQLLSSFGDPDDSRARGALWNATQLVATPSGETYAYVNEGSAYWISRFRPSGSLIGVTDAGPRDSLQYNPMIDEIEVGYELGLPTRDGGRYFVFFEPGRPTARCTVTKVGPSATPMSVQLETPLPYSEESGYRIALGPDDTLWIAESDPTGSDTGWERGLWVGHVGEDGTLLGSWLTGLLSMGPVEALAVDGGSAVYVGGKGGLWKYTPDGHLIGRVGGFGGEGDQRDAPESLILRASGVAVDDAGCVRVLDRDAGRILRFAYAPAPFSDVPYWHWAKDAIRAAMAADIVQGYGDGTYHPAAPVNRAQMAAYLARAFWGGDEEVPGGWETPSFADVPTDHWAFRYIEACTAQGIVYGYGDGTYQPEETVNRAQMAVYVARALLGGGDPWEAPEVPAFADVPAEHWAYRHVELCAALGIVEGYPDGLYHPEDQVTRDQMAVYVARAFRLFV
jgi:hypothetical protein